MEPKPVEPTPEPKPPTPLDRALTAISDEMAALLASGKPSRFYEVAELATVASQLQRRQPVAGVDDVGGEDGMQMVGPPPMIGGPIRPIGPPMRMARPAFNDAVDLNQQIVMLMQRYFDTEAEKVKAHAHRDSRIAEVAELTDLMTLRATLMKDGVEVPEALGTRIDHLLKRIGEPPHESAQSNPVVPALVLRGHPPDGAGGQDGGGVGEPLAGRASGDGGAAPEVLADARG